MSKLETLIQQLCPDGVEFRPLKECCVLQKGLTPIQKAIPGEYPLVVTATERKSSNTFQFTSPSVCVPLISSRGHGVASINQLYYQEGKFALGNILCGITPLDDSKLSARFLYYYLNHKKDVLIVPLMRGGANVSLTVDALARIKVPIPPLDVQKEIICIFDIFSDLLNQLVTELTARKKQYEYYRGKLLTFRKDITVRRLGETCIMKAGKAIPSSLISEEKTEKTPFKCYGGNGVRGYVEKPNEQGSCPLIGRQGALCGNVNFAEGDFYATEHAVVVKTKGKYDSRFLFYLLTQMNLNQYKSAGAQPGLAVKNILELEAPVPSLDEQHRIVSILDRFDAICNDLTSGLPAEIAARQKQYEYYRDKLLTFKPLT